MMTAGRFCREHCYGRRYVQHRTAQPHTCDARWAPHVRTPLSRASVRVVHSIRSGALTRAVKWHWITEASGSAVNGSTA
jgi:hypothetical protein